MPGDENAPAPLEPNVTVPLTVWAVPASVSDTVAVQLVPTFRATEPGEHETDTDVERCVTVTSNVPMLAPWVESPPYDPVIVCVPVPIADGVYVREQLADDELSATSAHDAFGSKPPAPLDPNDTDPVGVVGVPELVSDTVAVQVVLAFTATVAGAHDTTVEVDRRTVTSKVPLLVPCVESPPYDPVIVCVPSPADGVYATEQLADDESMVASVHEVPGNENVPEPLDPNDTDPVGVVFVPVLVSDTVAVHVVGDPVPIAPGAHMTAVDVNRSVTVTPNVPLLIAWTESSP